LSVGKDFIGALRPVSRGSELLEFVQRERKSTDAVVWSSQGDGGQCHIQQPHRLPVQVLMTSSPPAPLTACPSVADGVTAFHTFLKTEFSEENLDFWLACEDFKKTRSKTKLASKANRIFEEFVQSEAPREVRADPASAAWHWMGWGRDKTS